MSNFHGTEIDIWAGFGLVGSSEKNRDDYEPSLEGGFFMFSWANFFFLDFF